jgi:hypothetical protein
MEMVWLSHKDVFKNTWRELANALAGHFNGRVQQWWEY